MVIMVYNNDGNNDDNNSTNNNEFNNNKNNNHFAPWSRYVKLASTGV